MRSRLIAPLIVGIATLTVPAAATTAHTELITTTPLDGATLPAAPDEVVLEFSDELNAEGSGLVVADEEGTVLAEGSLDLAVADRNVLRAELGAVSGRITVTWTSHAVDGHRAEGSLTFIVGKPATPPDTAMEAPRAASPLMLTGGLMLGALVVVGTVRTVRGARRSR